MMIAVDTIDIVSGIREDTEDERMQMDLSIKHQGLLQRIVVIEHPDIPGRYVCLAGRRRLLSTRRLGWEKIDCLVTTGDHVSQELVEVTENLIRKELAPLERARDMKRYVDLWAARNPEVGEMMRARRQANLRRGDMPADAEAKGAPLEVEGAPVGAVKAVARAVGQSVRTVQKAVARAEKAKVFTPEQAAVLSATRLSDRRIDRLVKVEEPGKRSEVVNLVAAQMSFPAAMREVLGDEYEGDPEEEDAIPDDEFLAGCPIRPRVNQPKFDADALLWRRCGEARRMFARAIGWSKLKAEVGHQGTYFRRVLLVLDAPPPDRWLQCHDCTRGSTQFGECKVCRGCGYLIK